jgi:hypothetical protein
MQDYWNDIEPVEQNETPLRAASCSSEIPTHGMWQVVSATFHAYHATMGHHAGPFPNRETAQTWIDLQPNKNELTLSRKTISNLVFNTNQTNQNEH